jgi:hypothetical protein
LAANCGSGMSMASMAILQRVGRYYTVSRLDSGGFRDSYTDHF